MGRRQTSSYNILRRFTELEGYKSQKATVTSPDGPSLQSNPSSKVRMLRTIKVKTIKICGILKLHMYIAFPTSLKFCVIKYGVLCHKVRTT